MSQPVGDLVVKIDGDSSKFEEEVTHLNRQLGMISKTADATAASVVKSFSSQEAIARRAGISVGQYNAAMRMLPAQLTDVATQLAGGQNPWLILLQQGGQVKDSFGGISGTLKVFLSMLNPAYVALGAVALTFGTTAAEVYKARKEIEAANVAVHDGLGMTGDYAQKLALNIRSIAEESGSSVKAISEMFITSKDGADMALQKMISVGYSYQDAKARVDEYKNATDFTSLNSLIEQHKLKVLGLPDAWSKAAQEVKNYYTAADKGKQNVALGGAIDPILGVLEHAKDLQTTINDLRIKGNLKVKESVDWINKEYLAADKVAGAEARLTEARKRAKEIQFSGDKKAIDNASALIAAREKELEQAKKDRDKKPAYRTPAGTRADDTVSAQTLQLMAQLNVLQKHKGLNDTISEERKKLWKLQGTYSVLEEASKTRLLSKDEQSLLASKDKVLAQAEINANLGDQIAAQERLNKLQDNSLRYSTQMREKTAALTKSAGLGDRESQRKLERAQLSQGWQNQGGSLEDEGYKKELEALEGYYAAQDEMRGNWLAGVESSWQNYADMAANYNQIAADSTSSVLNGATSSIQQALSGIATQSESAGDALKNMVEGFGQTVIQTLTQLGAQWLVYQGVQLLVGKTTQAQAGTAVFANAQATALQAQLAAYASTAAIPVYGPAMAPFAAGTAATFTEPLVSAIGAYSLAGMAHDGIDKIPETGTWLLKQGERVTTARTSAKLDATLEAIGKQRESAGRSVTLNVSNNFSGKPDDATMMAIDSRNRELRKQLKAELTAEIASPSGSFGRTLRGVYPNRKMR